MFGLPVSELVNSPPKTNAGTPRTYTDVAPDTVPQTSILWAVVVEPLGGSMILIIGLFLSDTT